MQMIAYFSVDIESLRGVRSPAKEIYKALNKHMLRLRKEGLRILSLSPLRMQFIEYDGSSVVTEFVIICES